MSDSHVIYEVRDEIAFVTLARPQKLNALTSGMTAALAEAWVQAEADPEVKVIILRARGPSFCAGADLTAGHDVDESDAGLPWRLRMSRAIPKNGIRVFKPIIGCIQGYTLGVGYALAVKGCDITLAGTSAMLGYPESVAGIPTQPLEYIPYMPFKASLEFALMAWKNGRLVDAKRALELGLVNAVVDDEQLEAEALRWADMLKQVPPLYLKAVKCGHYRSIDSPRAQQDRDYLDYVWPQESAAARQDAGQRFEARKKKSSAA